MSNRKLQNFLIHPPFTQGFGRTRPRTCSVRASGFGLPLFQFARPLSTSSCQRNISLLPKTRSKHRKYHSVHNSVEKGSAATSETIPKRHRRPTSALGTALRPIECLQKSNRSEPCSRPALTAPNRFQVHSAQFPCTPTSAIWEPLGSACPNSHGMREKKNGGGILSVLSL